ncbi:MAG: nuclear transport factor 2 family protein [Nitrososphaera sp.]|jgi:ketosteroid isomerase-like protein
MAGTATNRDLVREYFNLISSRDLDRLLGLFTDDAVVYEPFSSEEGLHGRGEIEPFLKVVLMANAGLEREIIFPPDKEGDEITVQVRFQKGGVVRGSFTFATVDAQTEQGTEKRIKMLKIQFSS